MTRIVVILLMIIVVAVSSGSVLAHHQKDVLGESTTASETIFPPVTAGPGYLLPDHPLYVLDHLKQNIRLLFAFSPEEKARLHASIAGERLAELRIMVARNNTSSIQSTLINISQELEQSGDNLTEAHAQGKEVRELSFQLNDFMKSQRTLLSSVADQLTGSLKLSVQSTLASLSNAKALVEDTLPEDELEKELEENLALAVETEVLGVTTAQNKVEKFLTASEKAASKAAERALKMREEKMKKQKNEKLRKQEELRLQAERKKQASLLELRKKAAEQAREALKKSQEARLRMKEAQEKALELKNQSVDTTVEQ